MADDSNRPKRSRNSDGPATSTASLKEIGLLLGTLLDSTGPKPNPDGGGFGDVLAGTNNIIMNPHTTTSHLLIALRIHLSALQHVDNDPVQAKASLLMLYHMAAEVCDPMEDQGGTRTSTNSLVLDRFINGARQVVTTVVRHPELRPERMHLFLQAVGLVSDASWRCDAGSAVTVRRLFASVIFAEVFLRALPIMAGDTMHALTIVERMHELISRSVALGTAVGTSPMATNCAMRLLATLILKQHVSGRALMACVRAAVLVLSPVRPCAVHAVLLDASRLVGAMTARDTCTYPSNVMLGAAEKHTGRCHDTLRFVLDSCLSMGMEATDATAWFSSVVAPVASWYIRIQRDTEPTDCDHATQHLVMDAFQSPACVFPCHPLAVQCLADLAVAVPAVVSALKRLLALRWCADTDGVVPTIVHVVARMWLNGMSLEVDALQIDGISDEAAFRLVQCGVLIAFDFTPAAATTLLFRAAALAEGRLDPMLIGSAVRWRMLPRIAPSERLCLSLEDPAVRGMLLELLITRSLMDDARGDLLAYCLCVLDERSAAPDAPSKQAAISLASCLASAPSLDGHLSGPLVSRLVRITTETIRRRDPTTDSPPRWIDAFLVIRWLIATQLNASCELSSDTIAALLDCTILPEVGRTAASLQLEIMVCLFERGHCFLPDSCRSVQASARLRLLDAASRCNPPTDRIAHQLLAMVMAVFQTPSAEELSDNMLAQQREYVPYVVAFFKRLFAATGWYIDQVVRFHASAFVEPSGGFNIVCEYFLRLVHCRLSTDPEGGQRSASTRPQEPYRAAVLRHHVEYVVGAAPIDRCVKFVSRNALIAAVIAKALFSATERGGSALSEVQKACTIVGVDVTKFPEACVGGFPAITTSLLAFAADGCDNLYCGEILILRLPCRNFSNALRQRCMFSQR